MEAHSLPPDQRAEYALMHDARAVRDTGEFRFDDFEVDGVPSWVVAIINPDPDSGSATIPGGYIKAETGEIVIPEGVAPVVLKKGKWQALASGTLAQPAMGTYSWTEPFTQHRRLLTTENYYSPFAYGGTIVFQPTPGADGIEQFGPVYLLFSEWANFVQPAFAEFIQNSYSVYGKSNEPVSHENGLIATVAFGELIRDSTTTPQAVSKFLDTTDNRRRSIFAYAMVALPSPDKAQEFANPIVNRLQVSTQLDEVHSIALGAFAAALFHSIESEIIAEGTRILTAARSRLAVVGKSGEQASQIVLMCQKMGLE